MAHPTWWRWLDPELPLGTIAVADVLAESDPAGRGPTTIAWANDLWASYEPQHALVRGWLDALIGPTPSPGNRSPRRAR